MSGPQRRHPSARDSAWRFAPMDKTPGGDKSQTPGLFIRLSRAARGLGVALVLFGAMFATYVWRTGLLRTTRRGWMRTKAALVSRLHRLVTGLAMTLEILSEECENDVIRDN